MPDRLLSLNKKLIGLSRSQRIMIAVFFALMMTLAVFPLVDSLYLAHFYTPSTIIAPSLVTASLGGLMYLVGWNLYVGTVNVIPQAKISILWYFFIGVIATIIVLVLLIHGVTLLNLAD